MADDFYYTDPGTGTVVAAPEIGGRKYQAMLLADPTTPTQRAKVNSDGTQDVRMRREVSRIVVTPTVSNAVAYTAGDVVGGIMQFTNAARVAGGAGQILGAQILNKANSTLLPGELVFFDRTFTHPGDNAAWNPSDADCLNIVGILRMATTDDGRTTSAVWTNNIPTTVPGGAGSTVPGIPIPYVLNGTDLFAALVTGATPTLGSTTDIQVALIVEKF